MSSAPGGPYAARPSRRGHVRFGHVWPGIVLASLVVITASIYLEPYLMNPARFPYGIDTPGYVARTRVVHEIGLNALEGFGDRPAHPVVASILRDVAGGTPLDFARVNPAVMAIAIALAGVVLGLGAGEHPWIATAVGLAIAASPFVALTAIGYASNLLFDVFAVAAIAIAIRVRSGHPGGGALALLLMAAAIAHWMFAIGLILLLGAYAAGAFVHDRIRPSTGPGPAGHWSHLLVALALGAILGGLALLASPKMPSSLELPVVKTERKIAKRLPAMDLPMTIPLAAVGAATMLVVGGRTRKSSVPPLALAASVAPIGLLVWKMWDFPFPHRIVPLALGIPALIVLGAAGARSWISGRTPAIGWGRTVGTLVGALLVLGAAGWLAWAGGATWMDRKPVAVTAGQMVQAATLATYLEGLPEGTPVIVTADPKPIRPLEALQVTLPADRRLSLTVWHERFGRDPAPMLRRLARLFPADSVVAYLSSYSNQRPPRGRELGPGVVLVAGPAPTGASAVRQLRTTSRGELVRLALLSLMTLVIVGLGWTLALTDLRALGAISLSPVIGTMVLSLGGLVVGRLGAPLGGGGGAAIAAISAALGLLAFAIRTRYRTGRESASEPRR